MGEGRERVALVYRPGRHQTGPSTYVATLKKHLDRFVDFEEFPSVASAITSGKQFDCVHLLDIKQLGLSEFFKIQANQSMRFLLDIHDHYWLFKPGQNSFAIDGPLRALLSFSRIGVYGALLSLENVRSIVHSQAVANALRGFAEGRTWPDCQLAPYGVDDMPADPAPPVAGDYILFVGRDYFRKGLAVLFEALENIVSRWPHLKLVVIGGEYLHSSIFFRLKALRFKGRVLFFGGRSNEVTRTCIAHSRALVLPSYTEASSIAVMEAMSLGVPAIVSDAGGLPELFEGDAHLRRLVVPVGDSRALSAAIDGILSDAAGRPVLASALRKQWEDHFTGGHMAQRVAGAYSKAS